MSPKKGPLNADGISGSLMGVMLIKMNDANIVSVAQLRELVKLIIHTVRPEEKTDRDMPPPMV